MRRVHAFELEDQPWLPRFLRNYATDFLQFVVELGDSYAPAVPLLRRGLDVCGTDRVVDLGSGGGGPWPGLLARVRGDGLPVRVLLTDLYPSREAGERVRRAAVDGLEYHPEPVDAMRIPAELDGFRTLFTALHHFRPAEVRAILADTARSRQGFGAFELTERSVRGVLATALSPLLVLLLTPWLRPFRPSRLFWTYVVPAVPLVVLWDGLVSCLRTYTPGELRTLAESLGADGYVWEAGSVRGRAPVPVTYLFGRPVTLDASTRVDV